uniref:Uncharacterized protein n=1 Tax=Anguilla anguilla TaxID=7936 RepID=A0A0E9SVP9_ANGAN
MKPSLACSLIPLVFFRRNFRSKTSWLCAPTRRHKF